MVNNYTREKIYKKSGIYAIRNTINDRAYVGSSSNLYKRLNAHKNSLLKNSHINSALNNFCKTYGVDKFFVEIIEFCETKDLIIRENFYIKKLKGYGHGFNCSPIAESPCRGKETSMETRNKLSIARKKYISENTEENNNRLNKGRLISNKMRKEGLIKPSNLGKKASDETRLKQRLAKLGKPSYMTKEQMADRVELLRQTNLGTKSHFAKLKESDVLEIRKLISEGNLLRKDIAKQFNISPSTICDIDKRISWNHLK